MQRTYVERKGEEAIRKLYHERDLSSYFQANKGQFGKCVSNLDIITRGQEKEEEKVVFGEEEGKTEINKKQK